MKIDNYFVVITFYFRVTFIFNFPRNVKYMITGASYTFKNVIFL